MYANKKSKSRRSSKKLRGFPTEQGLRDLAEMYVDLCSKLQPSLVQQGILPKPGKMSVDAFVDVFTRTFTSGQFQHPIAVLPADSGLRFALAYVRYSDASSNPRSLAQQLKNVMEWASRNGYVILPEAVFADAAVTGSNTNRTGYCIARLAIQQVPQYHCFCVDELGRANRDLIESLTLGKKIVYWDKRFVGATDNLDSENPYWDEGLKTAASRQEGFLKELASKVMRGMSDGFSRGGVMGEPILGIKIEKQRDANGEYIITSKNKVKTEAVVDEEMAVVIRRIFEIYAYEHRSPQAIAIGLNTGEIVIDSPAVKREWNPSTIQQMLKNPKYRGEYIWNKTSSKVDPDTSIRKKVKLPESEWIRIEREDLRIVSDELWEAAERRRELVSRDVSGKGMHQSRSEAYPTTLLNLYCGCCDEPLQKYRSGKYPAVYCPMGKQSRQGCSLKTSKTVFIIEESVTARLRQLLIEETDYDRMLEDANAFIAEEAAKPPADLSRLDKDLKNNAAKIEKLKQKLKGNDVDQFGTLLELLQHHETERQQLLADRDLAKRSSSRPDPIDRESFMQLVENLRELLRDDVRASAAVLAKVCGPIRCFQGEKASKGHKWIGKLEFDPTPIMLDVARETGCPTTTTLEFLCGRSWTKLPPIELSIEEIAVERRIAEKAKQMHAAGSTVEAISRALNADQETVNAALELEDWEVVRYLPPRDTSDRKAPPNSINEKLTAEVVTLYDQEGKSFEAIAKKLRISNARAQRLYDAHNQQDAIKLAETGEKRKPRIPLRKCDDTHAEISRLLQETKLSLREIGRRTGVDKWTVRSNRDRLLAEGKHVPLRRGEKRP